jgi:FkbM family methyltransferase
MVGQAGTVHSFEPQRVVFQTLCANVALNSLTNVHCHQAAVADAPGEIIVPILDYTSENNFGGLGLGGYERGECVPVVTLDALHLDDCRLIKIDVEGMELQVLRGAQATIARCRPLLYVENDRPEHSHALIAHLLEQDYRLSAVLLCSVRQLPQLRECVREHRVREYAVRRRKRYGDLRLRSIDHQYLA